MVFDNLRPPDRRSMLRWLALGASTIITAVTPFACRDTASKAKSKEPEGNPPTPKAEPATPVAAEPTTPTAAEPTTPTAAEPTTPVAAEPTTPVAAKPARPITIKLEVGDGLQYSTNRIEVPAGSKVDLTILHTGKLPKAAMGHNFVLLKKGTNKDAFATAALSAQQTEYIPPSMKGSILAHTKLVGGGESDTVSFSAPKAGEYIFLCTFPGHYLQMNGKFIVT